MHITNIQLYKYSQIQHWQVTESIAFDKDILSIQIFSQSLQYNRYIHKLQKMYPQGLRKPTIYTIAIFPCSCIQINKPSCRFKYLLTFFLWRHSLCMQWANYSPKQKAARWATTGTKGLQSSFSHVKDGKEIWENRCNNAPPWVIFSGVTPCKSSESLMT